MTHRSASSLFALFVLLASGGDLNAQTANARATTGVAAKSIWQGVYTEAQASRGQRLVQGNCASCHVAAEWSHSSFLENWVGQPIRELHSYISSSMPLDSPGKLTSQEYSDIVAYMLKLNQIPVGTNELPIQVDSLRRIQITRRQ